MFSMFHNEKPNVGAHQFRPAPTSNGNRLQIEKNKNKNKKNEKDSSPCLKYVFLKFFLTTSA